MSANAHTRRHDPSMPHLQCPRCPRCGSSGSSKDAALGPRTCLPTVPKQIALACEESKLRVGDAGGASLKRRAATPPPTGEVPTQYKPHFTRGKVGGESAAAPIRQPPGSPGQHQVYSITLEKMSSLPPPPRGACRTWWRIEWAYRAVHPCRQLTCWAGVQLAAAAYDMAKLRVWRSG